MRGHCPLILTAGTLGLDGYSLRLDPHQALYDISGIGHGLQCCQSACVNILVAIAPQRLRDLYVLASAHSALETLLREGASAGALPTQGLGCLGDDHAVHDRPVLAEGSDASAVLDALCAAYSSPDAAAAARDEFVVDALRELVSRGCCKRSIRRILCCSNNYLYFAPQKCGVATDPCRLRRAGADVTPVGGAVPVSVEELAVLDGTTNEPCERCPGSDAYKRCPCRPLSKQHLLEARVRFHAAGGLGATSAQRALLVQPCDCLRASRLP